MQVLMAICVEMVGPARKHTDCHFGEDVHVVNPTPHSLGGDEEGSSRGEGRAGHTRCVARTVRADMAMRFHECAQTSTDLGSGRLRD